MKAVVFDKIGGPGVMKIAEVPKPAGGRGAHVYGIAPIDGQPGADTVTASALDFSGNLQLRGNLQVILKFRSRNSDLSLRGRKRISFIAFLRNRS